MPTYILQHAQILQLARLSICSQVMRPHNLQCWSTSCIIIQVVYIMYVGNTVGIDFNTLYIMVLDIMSVSDCNPVSSINMHTCMNWFLIKCAHFHFLIFRPNSPFQIARLLSGCAPPPHSISSPQHLPPTCAAHAEQGSTASPAGSHVHTLYSKAMGKQLQELIMGEGEGVYPNN